MRNEHKQILAKLDALEKTLRGIIKIVLEWMNNKQQYPRYTRMLKQYNRRLKKFDTAFRYILSGHIPDVRFHISLLSNALSDLADDGSVEMFLLQWLLARCCDLYLDIWKDRQFRNFHIEYTRP